MTPQDAKEFNKKLSYLMNQYKVTWKFQLVPHGWFTKLIKRFLRLNIVLGIRDKKPNEGEGV